MPGIVIDRAPKRSVRDVLEPPPLPQTQPVPDRAVEREVARQKLEAAREAREVARGSREPLHLPPASPADLVDLGRTVPFRAAALLLGWVGTPVLVKVLGVDADMVYMLLGMTAAFMGFDTLRPAGKAKRGGA